MVRAMLRRAINTIALAAGAPQWVQLLPAGTFTGRDGAGPYHLDDPLPVIDATLAAASGADLPIDYDHQLLWTRENGQPAVAAGWIKTYEARPDGIWGRVEWTPTAAGRLRDREYRYLSPVFWHDPDGTVTRIECAALTNVPNLELAAVASRLPNNGGEMDPKQILSDLAAALGMPPDTSQDKLLARAKSLAAKAKAPAAMAKRLGLADEAGPDAIEHGRGGMPGCPGRLRPRSWECLSGPCQAGSFLAAHAKERAGCQAGPGTDVGRRRSHESTCLSSSSGP